MKYQLKDYKSGSYSNDDFQYSLNLFLITESLNMFDYSILSKIDDLVLQALKYQFKSLIENQSYYNLHYDVEENKLYNNEICLSCSASLIKNKIHFYCENILKVENKNPKYRLSIEDIKNIQNEVYEVENFLNAYINEGLAIININKGVNK